MKRKILITVGIIVAVVLVLAIAAPFLVDADRFRPMIEAKLTDALGRKVEIGHLSFSLLSGSLGAEDVSIADDPAYSAAPFLKAKKLNVGVDVWPLIRSKELHIQTLELDSPELVLLRSAGGKWNFESLGGEAKPAPRGGRAASDEGGTVPGGFSVGKLRISNATLVLARQGAKVGNRPYTDVALGADNVSADTNFPITLAGKSPGGGKINLDGTFGPLGQKPAAAAPFDATLKVDKMPGNDVEDVLGALGIAMPSGASLRGGTVNANLKLKGPLERLVTTGPVSINNLNVSGFSLGSKMNAFGAAMGGGGGSDTLVQLLSSTLRLAPDGIRADDLKAVLPALGTITGSGTISPSNALHFNMVAKLNNASAAFAALGKLPILSQTNGELPFRVEGTTSNPQFIPDMQALMGGLLKNPLQNPLQQNPQQGLAGVLGGLLGGKKKP